MAIRAVLSYCVVSLYWFLTGAELQLVQIFQVNHPCDDSIIRD